MMNIFERFWYNTVLRNTVLIVLGVIALAYFVFVIMCVDVYFPGTKINGKDYSFKSPYYVDNEIYESGSDYILELKFRNGSEYIKGTDINLNYDYLRNLQNIKENQNPFLFLKGFGSAENIIAKEITYSEDMLDFTLQNLDELDPENITDVSLIDTVSRIRVLKSRVPILSAALANTASMSRVRTCRCV